MTRKNSVHQMTTAEIVCESSKVVTLVDLAGHERYIKTTVSGMTGCVPDYVMVYIYIYIHVYIYIYRERERERNRE